MTCFEPLRLTALILGLLASSASIASAQPLHVTVEGLDAAAFARALAAELERPVEVRDQAVSSPHLRIEVAEDGVATLELRTEEGALRQRVVAAGQDADEALRLLLLVASNLVRDPAEGLIGAAPESSPVSTPDALPEPPRGIPTPALEIPGPSEDPVSFAERHPLRLGAAGMLGLHNAGGQVSPFGAYGLSLFGVVHPNLAVGVTQLNLGWGVSSFEGLILDFSGTPSLELAAFVDPHVQVYGQAGVTLQFRTQTSIGEDIFQVAPRIAGGVRMWATEWFSVSVELGVSVVATDALRISGVNLPQGTMPGTLGLAAEFHIAP
ncbi:MAG: hypothetical protein AB8I08_00435 [Sandaracinaceae bacterium]